MATNNVFRHFGRSLFCHPLFRRQHTRLLCFKPRVIFAANKYLQNSFLVSNSFETRPPPLLGVNVRLFADAGTALTRDEIQTRVMDVLKLFDKVNAEQVNIANLL